VRTDVATWDDVRAVAQELPDAVEEQGPEESFFSVRGRWFAVKSRHEDDAIVVHADPEERRLLVDANPSAYYLAPRFERRDHLGVRLEAVTLDELHERLVDSWLVVAPRRLRERAPVDDE
jgi:hypothetical protein